MSREVVNVVPSSEAMSRMGVKPPPVEVREKRDGSWVVLYPDPGFIPCAPNCAFGQQGQPFRGHKHEHKPRMIECEYKPTSFDDARVWAERISDTQDKPLVIPYTGRRLADYEEREPVDYDAFNDSGDYDSADEDD